jgi:DNA helicase II / ATP-dependent DNA helicase PcrA
MSVTSQILPTELEQFQWIALKINSLLESGVEPSEIAILSRKHPTLQKISATLLANNIPFAYEKKENVLEQKHIQELIIMLQFVNCAIVDPVDADFYLSKILGFSWMNVDALELWNIALESRNNWLESEIEFEHKKLKISRQKLWSEVILEKSPLAEGCPKDGVCATKIQFPKSKQILEWLLGIAKDCQGSSFETVTDILIGVDVENKAVDIDEEVELEAKTTPFEIDQSEVVGDSTVTQAPKFQSQYKKFYFDNNSNPASYTKLLSNLRKLIHTIRDYQSNRDYSVQSSVKIIENLTKNNIAIIDNSPFNNPNNCVNLMTVHSSKGLEFEHVFVINCQAKDWQKTKGNSNMITLPLNLKTSSKEDSDDFVRLFFVAVTRAKLKIVLTGYETAESGKPEPLIDFLVDNESIPTDDFESTSKKSKAQSTVILSEAKDPLSIQVNQQNTNELLTTQQSKLTQILTNNKSQNSEAMLRMLNLEYKDLLANTIQNYKLSVTHLTNYLDVTKGGPKKFLENNLLRFPYSKNPKSKYGTAIHEAITRFYQFWQKENSPKPELSKLLNFYEFALRSQCLDNSHYQDYLKIGRERLTNYYNTAKLDINSKLAVNFNLEEVVIGRAKIKVELDKVDFDIAAKEIIVTDYKTGEPLESWKPSGFKATKAWSYQTQLEFYKILVENSRSYEKYKVNTGILEFVDNFDRQESFLKLQIEQQNIENLLKIVKIVYTKIINLEFPDTDHYSQDLKGIKQFMQDLLDSKV